MSPEGCTVNKRGYERGKRTKKKNQRKRKNREKFVKIFWRNNSSYFSCNNYTVLEFSRWVNCCSDVQLAGLQIVVPKKPLCLSEGISAMEKWVWCTSHSSWAGKAVGFGKGGLTKTPHPTVPRGCTQWLPSGHHVVDNFAGWMLESCRHWEPRQPRPSVPPSTLSGVYLERDVSAAPSSEHRGSLQRQDCSVQPCPARGRDPAASSLCTLWIPCGNAALGNNPSRTRKFRLFI